MATERLYIIYVHTQCGWLLFGGQLQKGAVYDQGNIVPADKNGAAPCYNYSELCCFQTLESGDLTSQDALSGRSIRTLYQDALSGRSIWPGGILLYA